MASPQRPEFHGLSDDASRSGGQRPGRPPAKSRATFLFAWLIAVMLVAVFLYWIAWGWGNSGGYWWHGQHAPVTSSSGHAVKGPGLAALDATNKQPFVGKYFQLTNVPIQRKVSERLYWIGTNDQSPMLLVLTGNQSTANFSSLTAGSLVDVAGTVEKAPPTTDAASQWSLSEPELAQLEKQGAYLSATQMYLAPK